MSSKTNLKDKGESMKEREEDDEKKKETGPQYEGVNETKITLNVRCRDCLYFATHKIFSKPCQDLGIIEESRPCRKFMVNPFKFNFKEEDYLLLLRELMKKIPKKRLPAFAALIQNEAKNRAKGLYFGQQVYVRLYPEDYISNYARAWVISSDRKYVYIRGKRRNNFRGMLFRSSVLSFEEWKQKKDELRKKNKFNDPLLPTYLKVSENKSVIDYEPPTIDDIEDEIKKKNKNKNKRKKKGSKKRQKMEVFSVR